MKAVISIAALALALAAPREGSALGAGEDGRPQVDVVFCIDRSGSMSGVIETAKQKVWGIVNDIARSKPAPALRIGLIGYGSADREAKFFPLTDDLDKVYENLVTFRVDMGGDEWVGWVVKKAVEEMSWGAGKEALRIIFVVGNETAAQGRKEILYTKTVPKAIEKDITVNAIYCGRPNPDEARTWTEVARLADGLYTTIDLSGGAITIETPMDKVLVELNGRLNATYLPFGKEGETGRMNQLRQDENSSRYGGDSNMASRAGAKSWAGYRCRWDLVDASKERDFDLSKIKGEDLPEAMRPMNLEERRAYILEKGRERESIQQEIRDRSLERQKHIDGEVKRRGLTQDAAFDEAVRRAIRGQAGRRGFTFEENP